MLSIKEVDEFEEEDVLKEEDEEDVDLEFEIEAAKEDQMEEQKMIKTSRVRFKRLNCSAHKVHLCR